ncbi:hypothetical protein F5890DRAFT_1557503 [Lentinula detonsa]|uniref:Uncharacterized protein n=1 Tax=Lentinula detonsa TaxID=2804962 RepID=A0AA38UPI3_9AGAR|nr:hypothetical protein F5890DRAFT_1557503 [Lentinula detonsa]
MNSPFQLFNNSISKAESPLIQIITIMHPFTVFRLLVAISLIITFATTIHALPSPSSNLDVDSEALKARSPLEFRGRAFKNFRRDLSIDSRDILLNKASDLKRAQRFRAAQKKKRNVIVENMLPRVGGDAGTTEKSESTPVTPAPSLA